MLSVLLLVGCFLAVQAEENHNLKKRDCTSEVCYPHKVVCGATPTKVPINDCCWEWKCPCRDHKEKTYTPGEIFLHGDMNPDVYQCTCKTDGQGASCKHVILLPPAKPTRPPPTLPPRPVKPGLPRPPPELPRPPPELPRPPPELPRPPPELPRPPPSLPRPPPQLPKQP